MSDREPTAEERNEARGVVVHDDECSYGADENGIACGGCMAELAICGLIMQRNDLAALLRGPKLTDLEFQESLTGQSLDVQNWRIADRRTGGADKRTQ